MFGRRDLVIENIKINTDTRYKKLDGLRILHFSDLHLTKTSKQYDDFFARLKRVECDLIIVSGDVIDADPAIDACVEYLSGLKSKYGTFVTYGNHDKFQLGLKELIFFRSIMKDVENGANFSVLKDKFKINNLDLLKTKLGKAGIRVLINEIIPLSINGDKLELVGIDCPLGYDRLRNRERFKTEVDSLKELIGRLNAENYAILISHIPDLIRELDTGRIDLVLSGHTHGGQIRLPFIGPLVAISHFQRRYSMGLFKYNSTYLHVSSGIGTTSNTPIRFKCPPRATVIMLKSC